MSTSETLETGRRRLPHLADSLLADEYFDGDRGQSSFAPETVLPCPMYCSAPYATDEMKYGDMGSSRYGVRALREASYHIAVEGYCLYETIQTIL